MGEESWTGNVWKSDDWTEEEKSKARNEIAATQTNRQTNHHHGDKRSNSAAAFHDFRKNASSNWNTFYNQNKTNFFKDRHYLHKAFPNEFGWLYNDTDTVSSHNDSTDINENYGEDVDDDGNVNAHDYMSKVPSPPPVGNDGIIRIVEIGCGVGNAILPLLEQHTELMKKAKKGDQQVDNPLPQLHIHCLDFAPTAIQLLKEDARFQYAAKEHRATGHVYDLSSMHPSTVYIGNNTDTNHDDGSTTTSRRQEVLANSADVAILLFCLSAIGPHPSPSLSRAAKHAIDILRPGGTLVIRDYGRLDEAQLKLGKADKELGDNFYRKGDGTGCYYFSLDDLRDLFVNKDDDDDNETNKNDKLELLELDYIQRVYRNRGEGTTRRRVWVQGRFRKPLLNHKGEEKRFAVTQNEPNENTLQNILDNSIQSWDDHYKALSAASILVSPLPSNLFHAFPDEFKSWSLWQPSTKKGKRQLQSKHTQSVEMSSAPPSEVTVIDLGCGIGNDTLLNLVEKQQLSFEEKQQNQSDECQPIPPTLNVHFLDASSEAIEILQNDSRYQRALVSINELKCSMAATVTSQVCNLASNHCPATVHLEQSADIILLLFTLSAIGPYHSHSSQSCYSGLVNTVKNATNLLKPGGIILFRDYARYDYDQLQLNSVVGSQLCPNFYVRGLDDDNHVGDDKEADSMIAKGTCCYFFDIEEVRSLFTSAGLKVLQLEYITRVYKNKGNGTSKRRVFVQGRFNK